METGIERLAVIGFLIVGLSHILRPRAWVDFFVQLRHRGEAGVFMSALISLPLGCLVAAFHNVWTGLPAVLTVIGWAHVAKSTTYLLWPQWGLRKLAIVTPERSYLMVLAGLMLVALSAVLAVPAFG